MTSSTVPPGAPTLLDPAPVATQDLGGDAPAVIDAAASDGRSGGSVLGPVLLGVSVVVALLQLVVLVVLTLHEWRSYELTLDFANSYQAFWLLGHGHLDPFSTIYRASYFHNEGGFALWPLALLWPLTHSSFTLVAVSDVAIAACTMIGGIFAAEVVAQALPGRWIWQVLIVGGTLALLCFDPFALEAALFQFHLEPITALALLLAVRALWRRDRLAPFVYCAIALSTGTLASLLVIGLGAGVAVFYRGRRRQGLVIALLGLFWALTLYALHADQGTGIQSAYQYLVPHTHLGAGFGGVVTLVVALASHPLAPLRELWSRRALLAPLGRAGGIVGVLSPFGFGIALFDLAVNGLRPVTAQIVPQTGGFQQLPEIVVVIAGSALVAAVVVRRSRAVGVLAGVALVALMVPFVSYTRTVYHDVTPQWFNVPPAAVATLRQARSELPQSDGVIASQGIVGRFAGRSDVAVYLYSCQLVPLEASETAFIIAPSVGVVFTPPAIARAAVTELRQRYHASQLLAGGGVYVELVRRTASLTSVLLPGAGGPTAACVPAAGIP
jgi:hypothetical protein